MRTSWSGLVRATVLLATLGMLGCHVPASETSAEVDRGGKTEVAGEPCGPVTCEVGQVCCNESCGICTPPDGACTQQLCDAPGVPCGPNTCAAGEVCCNESCGICTPPDGFCTQQHCGAD